MGSAEPDRAARIVVRLTVAQRSGATFGVDSGVNKVRFCIDLQLGSEPLRSDTRGDPSDG
jgi:hypothetical protein